MRQMDILLSEITRSLPQGPDWFLALGVVGVVVVIVSFAADQVEWE